MKFWIVYILVVIGVCFSFGVVLWTQRDHIVLQTHATVSPVPDFLTRTANDQVSTISLFLPMLGDWRTQSVLGVSEEKTAVLPQVEARSVLVYDLLTEQTLFEKNSKERLPLASLAKIMTAIIALENKKADDRYKVTKDNLVGENSMGLTEGEILSLEELLYGLLLPSGNDAAETLASNYPLGRDRFVEAMNAKIQALGLSDTHFTNPSGLQGDGNQYSTAYDILVMTTYALRNFPLFADVVDTFSYEIPQTATHKYFYLENETNLLSTYPGVKGVKTGYTPEAGLCLVTYLEYEEHKIIGVLLGSNNRRQEMKDLLDYSLRKLGKTPPLHS